MLLNRPQPLETDGEINRFRPIVQALAPRVPDWLTGQEADNVAVAARRLTDDLYASLRRITLDALHAGDAGVAPLTAIARWEQGNSARLSRARATRNEISDAGNLDLAILSVAVRALTRL